MPTRRRSQVRQSKWGGARRVDAWQRRQWQAAARHSCLALSDWQAACY